MLKAKSSEKFSKSKNLRNFALLGALEIRVYEKLRFLLQKAHPCVNARRLSHFASKLVAGSDLQAWAGKKSQKVSDSHRNDVSPLTQGLRYRAACDKEVNNNIKKLMYATKKYMPECWDLLYAASFPCLLSVSAPKLAWCQTSDRRRPSPPRVPPPTSYPGLCSSVHTSQYNKHSSCQVD